MDNSVENLTNLVNELRRAPECEWVEFKVNDDNPYEIGQYISALANSATLVQQPNAFMIWGVSDSDRIICGTTFDPSTRRRGNEELEGWLHRQLGKGINFRFHTVTIDEMRVVVLQIDAALHEPVQFEGQDYIRIGSYKKKLKDYPEKERALWRCFDHTSFEEGIATTIENDADVLTKLDYPAYFDLLGLPLPDNRDAILAALADERLILRSPSGGWSISNLGGIMFAKRLTDFPSLKRKALRVILYRGAGRSETIKEQEGIKGYAAGFNDLVFIINSMVPSTEEIGRALRQTVHKFPELAVRELVANALIHQDFAVRGAGPMVEIFENRIEISNPGKPLVDTQRFIDARPISRNEILAALMRRVGICEERGSGWDKVIGEVEKHHLAPPLIDELPNDTRVLLFTAKPFKEMDSVERLRALYQHACLVYVDRKSVTNASVRSRFGIEKKNMSIASRLLADAVEAHLLVLKDEFAPPKKREYLPVWARPGQAAAGTGGT